MIFVAAYLFVAGLLFGFCIGFLIGNNAKANR